MHDRCRRLSVFAGRLSVPQMGKNSVKGVVDRYVYLLVRVANNVSLQALRVPHLANDSRETNVAFHEQNLEPACMADRVAEGLLTEMQRGWASGGISK